MMIYRTVVAIFLLLCITFSTTTSRLHYIRPFENSSCSSSTTDDLSLSCDTLEQLIKSNASCMERNMTLVLFSGNHSLISELVVTNTQIFMIQSDSENQDTFIICNTSAKFLFISVTEVKINGLKFIGCGENTMQFVRNLTITECMFIGTMNSRTPLVLSNTEAQIKDSQFLSNTIGRDYYYNNSNVRLELDFKLTSTEKIHINASGAIFVTHSNVTLVRCIFNDNRADSGAALFVENKSYLILILMSAVF